MCYVTMTDDPMFGSEGPPSSRSLTANPPITTRGLLKPRDPDTVYAWLGRYQSEGAAGLIAHPQGGSRGRYL